MSTIWLQLTGQQSHAPTMKLVLAFIALATVMLVGCGTTKPLTDEPKVNLTGYPPPFRDGYIDGCSSARHPGKTIQNQARYKSDSMYATGWRDGFDICSRENSR